MPSLSQAQPSGYALSVGEILNIASLATKLQQDNFENQKNLQQGEGMTSQGSAQAIQNVTNKQADGMAAGAVGEIESSAIGLSGTVLTQAFDAYSTYSNKLTSEIESVDAFDEQLTTLNKRPANVQLQNLDGSIDDDTREQLNAVKTVDIKTAKAADYEEALEVARGQPGDETYNDFKARVRRTSEELHADDRAYREKINARMGSYNQLSQVAGQPFKAAADTEAANQKKQEATLQAAKISVDYTNEAYKSSASQTSQNGNTLESSKEMAYRMLSGVAESNKV